MAKTKADLQNDIKSLQEQIKELEKKLNDSLQENIRIQTKYSSQILDSAMIEQLQNENERLKNMYELTKDSVEHEKKMHERTREQYRKLHEEHEELKELYENQNKSNNDNNDTIINSLKSFEVNQNMNLQEIHIVQSQIKELNKLLQKIDVKMNLEKKNNNIIFSFFYNLEKMRKVIIRNPRGQRKKTPAPTLEKQMKNITNGTDERIFFTYDEVKEMMKEKTAEQLAQEFGFSRMTFFRKLKQAKERENHLFY